MNPFALAAAAIIVFTAFYHSWLGEQRVIELHALLDECMQLLVPMNGGEHDE